jgi:hypothetical protein
LGKFASVFQTEIYAILLCAYENIRRAYKHKRIHNFSDSQATLKALIGPKVFCRLVEERQEALTVLATLNVVTLICVPGHCGIPGNEIADRLARQESSMPLLGDDLLQLGRHQLKMAVGILTGHAPVIGHLQTLGLHSGNHPADFTG